MILIKIILAFIAIIEICLVLFILFRQDELDEMRRELDKYSVHLDERANKIAIEEDNLRTMVRAYNKAYNELHSKDIYTASYTETDSDVMKYTTDKAVAANAKKHIATAIANDIVKDFSAKEDLTDDGRKRFTYRLKIVEQ